MNFNYHLPPDLIAQTPARPRDGSRLMLINRRTGQLSHRIFRDLPQLLRPADVLVFNNTAVFPARLFGHKSTGGKVEILLLRQIRPGEWDFISHPGLKPGAVVHLPEKTPRRWPEGTPARWIKQPNPEGIITNSGTIHFSSLISHFVYQYGTTPLPPYIHSSAPESALRRQYQTVYAKHPGSAAAPTAGLHFTPRLLHQLSTLGYQLEYVTLHVGLGTFKPPTQQQIRSGILHREYFTLDAGTTGRLNAAKSANRRIIAVGTTTTRVLETCSDASGRLHPRTGDTSLFILPGYKFKFVDGLITNFHLPKSSLLMLVSAFASPRIIQSAYHEAITEKYRFYSFGDACLII